MYSIINGKCSVLMNELSVPYACATPRKMYDCEIHSFSQIHIGKIKVTVLSLTTVMQLEVAVL